MPPDSNAIVAIYKSHVEAEVGVRQLQKSGFDVQKISIVGRDHQTAERVIGNYSIGERMRYWGTAGAFWGYIWGLLLGSAFFLLPGAGPFLVAGPLVGLIVGASEGAAVVGGLSAIGAGLLTLGIPKASVQRYEAACLSGRFVVIAHGTVEETTRARAVIAQTAADVTAGHRLDPVGIASSTTGA